MDRPYPSLLLHIAAARNHALGSAIRIGCQRCARRAELGAGEGQMGSPPRQNVLVIRRRSLIGCSVVPRHPRAGVAVVADKSPPPAIGRLIGMGAVQEVWMEEYRVAGLHYYRHCVTVAPRHSRQRIDLVVKVANARYRLNLVKGSLGVD